MTIWEDMYGEGGRAIYEPHEQITARIEATIDTLINEFAEAWTHSQGIGHDVCVVEVAPLTHSGCDSDEPAQS